MDINTRLNSFLCTLIENDHLGEWSPEKDCCLRLTFRQPVRKPSEPSESRVNPCERFDWSIDRAAVGKAVM